MIRERSPWRLLPSEQILWEGRPVRGATRDLGWRLGPLLVACAAAIVGLYGALLRTTTLSGASQLAFVAGYLALFALVGFLAPRYLIDDCEYALTDRRVLWRRGRTQRWFDRGGLSFARVTWSAALPGVGHLELVRATPYGPLARKQRLVLHNLQAPDRVLARIRGVAPVRELGDPDLPLTDRLDLDEQLVWGGGPQGRALGLREAAVALLGVGTLVIGVLYARRMLAIIVYLEQQGELPVSSLRWFCFVLATLLTWCVIAGVGAWLAWRSLFAARVLGRATEYVVTSQRVLIRRGRTELSLDRSAIADVIAVRASDGCHDVFLLLDAPDARALAVSGALTRLGPARELVPPVLFGLRDAESVCALLLPRRTAVSAAA